jgi:ribosomal protein S18 acetylase RimI-like enzyme
MPEPKEKFLNGSENEELERVKFREIRMEDCDDMVELINSVVQEKAYIRRKKEITREELLEGMKKTLGSDKFIFLGAELDGKIIGWGLLTGPESGTSDTVELGDFVIIKRVRSAGISDELLERIIAEARSRYKIKRIVLETSVSNTPAVHLYERHGFKKTDKAIEPRDHYGKVEERIEMEKILSDEG